MWQKIFIFPAVCSTAGIAHWTHKDIGWTKKGHFCCVETPWGCLLLFAILYTINYGFVIMWLKFKPIFALFSKHFGIVFTGNYVFNNKYSSSYIYIVYFAVSQPNNRSKPYSSQNNNEKIKIIKIYLSWYCKGVKSVANKLYLSLFLLSF